MVGKAVLGKIISADALRAVAGADHSFAGLGTGGMFFGLQFFINPAAQNTPGFGPIFMLTLFILHTHRDTGGQMFQLDRGIDFIDVLAARTAGACYMLDNVVGLDIDFDFLGLGQNRHRGGMRPCASVSGTRCTRWPPPS